MDKPNESEKPNIYPPSIIDPLKPGGIQSTPDGTDPDESLDCVACGHYFVKPGGFCPGCGAVDPRLPAVPLDPRPPFPDAPTSPPQPPDPEDEGGPGLPPPGGDAPIDVLRGIVLGEFDPDPVQPVLGAAVEYCPRPNVWRPACAQRVVGVDKAGNVLLDLVAQASDGGVFDAFSSPLGTGVSNWRFPLA